MKNLILVFLFLLSLSFCQCSFLTPNAIRFSKKITQGLIVPFLIINPLTVFPSHGIGALDAASKAMFDKKERIVEDREFSELPAAAKKRKAVSFCKDDRVLKAAGYQTAASCTSDAIDGNYDRIIKASKDPIPSISSKRSSTSNEDKTSDTKRNFVIEESDEATSSPRSKDKTSDLSDLAPAAKKRRALAACKKTSTRKAARMGSESSCTEKVLRGSFESLIEALEYGE